MARRDWGVSFVEDSRPGDEESMAAAMALAHRYGAEVILSVMDGLLLLERIGGQLLVLPQRNKYTGQGERIDPVEARKHPGAWVTEGFLTVHETRDIAIQQVKAPDEVDLDEADRIVRPVSLRDEIEAEVEEMERAEEVSSEEAAV
jgi:hypothetical protein